MNISRISPLALIAVLWFPTGANAHCDEIKHAGSHPHCAVDDGSGGDSSSQEIGIHDDTSHPETNAVLWAPTDASPACVLQKGPGNSLSGAFSRHDMCATVYKEGNLSMLGDDIVVLVSKDKRGAVLGVQVQGQDVIGSIGVVHVSDVMVPSSIVNNPDGTMVIHVHSDDVHMFKCDTHVLKKKSVCTIDVGTFAIDDMVYSAAL